jgi:hypothetical protein
MRTKQENKMNIDNLKYLLSFNERANVRIDEIRAKRGDDFNFLEAIEELDENEAFVMALSCFNYQVENGGIIQWVHNEYDDTLDVLLEFLNKLIDANKQADRSVDYLNKLVESLDDVIENINVYDDAKSAYHEVVRYNHLLEAFTESFEEMVDNELSKELSSFDKWYYTINQQLLTDADAFFKAVECA